MCGIAGWIDFNKNLADDRESLRKMTASLAHRGPDQWGEWYSNTAALGHRRLSVIDPENGLQPMLRSLNGHDYVIVYNGELYNTYELRRLLENEGCHFTTRSDTEVVLYAYMLWGIESFKKLNGIFAFAVWNEAAKKLILCRDRLGVKPLFYMSMPSTLIFASEVKAILLHPMVTPVLDENGLKQIFALGPARMPGTTYIKGIEELRPGHYLEYSSNRENTHAYWELKTQLHRESLADTLAHTEFLVADSIRRQLVSDVPICTFLSGGLDSSLITAVAAESIGKLNSFSVDYKENELHFKSDSFQPDPDSKWTGRISSELKTQHRVIYLDNTELAENLFAAAELRDEPGMADIDSSLLLFCREVKKFATVALSGECADEIFGGYPWYHQSNMKDSPFFPWSGDVELRSCLLEEGMSQKLCLNDFIMSAKAQTLCEISSQISDLPDEERCMRKIQYLNLTWFMSTLLNRKDRMSMGCGLEVRVPFCDHRIVEYLWNVPWTMKNYLQREKGLLRKVAEAYLPYDIAWRKKSPYPKTHHPLYVTRVREMLQATLLHNDAPIRAFVNKRFLDTLVQEGIDTERPWFGQLMKGPQLIAWLLQLNHWLAHYKICINI